MDQLNSRAYLDLWDALDYQLDAVNQQAGLGSALWSLHEHQVQSGFIQDDLNTIRRFRMPCPINPERAFSAQFNPARGRRFRGAGAIPAADSDLSINGGCFLCAENIWWQQQGAEIGYRLRPAGGRYTAWMNPFPVLPGHAVIASREHWPQHWQAPGSLSLHELVDDLSTFSELLPGWLTFYNGVGAGASIPHHLHFHAIPRPAGYEIMPLEAAAQRCRQSGRVLWEYPLSFMHWGGQRRQILPEAQAWVEEWQTGSGSEADATANIIACTSPSADRLDLYFIPRHQRRSRGEGLAGIIGGFEALGEIVCSSSEDLERLERGEVDYDTVTSLLRHVSVAF
ncbi:MAG: DUF4922 domain-containing protein [Wenzhouxiangella sp.]|nr:MAG: DUF4922 domain-containing protein [Wenzhouxiangella sp.]